MLDIRLLPHSLKLMGFVSSDIVEFWAASIQVQARYRESLLQALQATAELLPHLRLSGYFLDYLSSQHEQTVVYQLNRVPGPAQKVLSDQELKLQLATLTQQLSEWGIPYTQQIYTMPPQPQRFCVLIGLGKGFSGECFSAAQVRKVLQRQGSWQGSCLEVSIYALGGGEEAYEEAALLVPCENEVDLHWVCMTLLIFWQEWATVYDKQEQVAYRLVTTLEALRSTLYPA
ncbi:hypothetical protein EPA93_27675 [Ktedonosporobacter rubrisoli]|uniref:Uncharacterized protein n=1 Tax=Ktedonosporobacter rubrisoli TaxID=2509675 RepID=A0A4P6JW05_KTERU|nr:hypothetical protein [Ktedonosporobacter rubrisoli]QBD79552.1 hypothetical protein EPA93_27675 [Ktedonosporobacter rubrisoli]